MRDCLITVISLLCAFVLSLLFQYRFDVREHISTVFVFAVFLVSLLTEGYIYGVAAAFIGTVAVNYAFTFPYFTLNFTIQVNLISGIIMIAVAVLTGALTQTEYNIVALLSENCGKMMTYAAIIKAIWGSASQEGSIKKLQVNMANIRKKFGDKPGGQNYFANELGVGYRMNE